MLRHLGFARFPGNPAICGKCIKSLNKVGIYGAEIPVSLLFADIRGSTSIGESVTPGEYHAFLDGFYRIAAEAILRNNGMVDKFVGDEAIGLFFRGISGRHHAAAAIQAARDLLNAAGRADATQRGALSVGAAVHTGNAYVGSTGVGEVANDFTALGDVVNTTARIVGEAAAGELLVSEEAATAAGIDVGMQHRIVSVRGRSRPVTVFSLASGRPR